LTTVSKLAGILTIENKNSILKEVQYKSTRQVEAIVARFNPRQLIRDRVRPVFIKSFQETPEAGNASSKDSSQNTGMDGKCSKQVISSPENWVKFTSGAGGKKLATSGVAHTRKPVLEQKFKLEFAVDPEFMEKLEEVRALLSKKYPRGVAFEKLFEEMLDEYLDKHSPQRKIRRREKRKTKKNTSNKIQTEIKKTKVTKTRTIRQAKSKNRSAIRCSRYISPSVQDEVFTRDRGRCTFVGTDGVRCSSTWNLEIDHIKPFARGGDHSLHNLRLLCAKHNNLEAERVFGRDFMELRRCKAPPTR
jgi:5-methylcytosine-specific restriction endonuclease McrA